jgi:ABC-type polysaccharide/polyol phosphate transport system ATPase subunit
MTEPSEPSEPMIELSDVHLSFPLLQDQPGGVKEAFLARIRGRARPRQEREFWALRGISLEVGRGQVLGVIGKNGSGKSSLIRVIGGIYAPDKGQARTKGRIAMLQLGSGFRDELTGVESIRLSGAILGFSPQQIRSEMPAIIEFSGLGSFIHQPLRTYSSGMKARLGFAVASCVAPDILLLDEVLAVGDAEFAAKSLRRIEQMVAGKATVVIASHDLVQLRRLCSRMVLIERGTIACDGAPETVIEQYGA